MLKLALRLLVVLTFIATTTYISATWLLPLTTEAMTTVALGETGYNAVYTVSWGTGMDERISISHSDGSGKPQTSGWVEIFKKPYWSGMSLYRSEDSSAFYVGQGMGFYRFVPSTGDFQYSCEITDFLAYSPLGLEIAGIDHLDASTIEARDPSAPHLQGYLDPNAQGDIQSNPPPSKYYVGARYLGKFGILEGGTRGSGVGFASRMPEPRMGLSGRCP